MLRNIGIAAGLIGALAASGAVLVAQAKPEPAAKAAPNFQSKSAAPKTFTATCNSAEQVDTRVEPAWVSQSYANDGCVAPALPARLDGYTANRQQVLASMASQKAYAVKAGAYQRCIADYVVARRAAAESGKKTLEVALVVIEDHRITASEAAKDKVNAQVKETIRAFNESGSEDCK